MVLLAADAVRKGASTDVFSAALALEWTHTFTLVHDDIMDGDSLRRGRPTVHVVWDEPTAILAGDVLYAKAFEYLCSVKNASAESKVAAVQMLSHACYEICEGQQEDVSFETRNDVTAGMMLPQTSILRWSERRPAFCMRLLRELVQHLPAET